MSSFAYTVTALVLTGAACTASLATAPRERPVTVVTTQTKAQEPAKTPSRPQPQAQGQLQPLACTLHLSETARGVTLRAEVQAGRALEGSYELAIDHRGSGGRATIRQGGPFALKPGERATLSESEIKGRARDLSAELTLRAGGQVKTCRTAAL